MVGGAWTHTNISWRWDSQTVFTTSSVLVVGRAPASGCRQYLCPRGESQLPPASPRASPEVSKWVWPRLLSHYRLCPGSPRARDSVCALRVESVTHGRPALLKVSPPLAFKDAFPGGPSSLADKARVGFGSSASGRTPAVGTAFLWVFPLTAQTVKRLPTVRETRVPSLGREGPLRRKWPPTPVLLTGKSHGQRSLVGYSPWGRKESDTTEDWT